MRNLTWRQIAVILGCVLTLATLAVGIYGLVRFSGWPLPERRVSWQLDEHRRTLRYTHGRAPGRTSVHGHGAFFDPPLRNRP